MSVQANYTLGTPRPSMQHPSLWDLSIASTYFSFSCGQNLEQVVSLLVASDRCKLGVATKLARQLLEDGICGWRCKAYAVGHSEDTFKNGRLVCPWDHSPATVYAVLGALQKKCPYGLEGN
jgi:hypothetical protein